VQTNLSQAKYSRKKTFNLESSPQMPPPTAKHSNICPQDVMLIKFSGANLNSQKGRLQLEHAACSRIKYLIVEDEKLYHPICKCIRFGNLVHKTCVITGTLSVLVSGLAANTFIGIYASLTCASVSLLCSVFYFASWQSDYLAKYQIVRDPSTILRLSSFSQSDNAIFLQYRNDQRRKVLHNVLSVFSMFTSMNKFY